MVDRTPVASSSAGARIRSTGTRDASARPAADYLLHGLWLPERGLCLWIEQTERRKVLPSQTAIPFNYAGRSVFQLLSERPNRREKVWLQGSSGAVIQPTIPVWSFVPEHAVAVLTALREYARLPEMAPDLRFLVRVAQGLERFALAGRAMIGVRWQLGSWWPQWRMMEGLDESAWLAQVHQTIPPVVRLNAGDAGLDHLFEQIFHWTVNLLLADGAPGGSSVGGLALEQRQGFVRALLESSELPRAKAELSRAFAQWRRSCDVDELRLQLVITEPPGGVDDLAADPELDLDADQVHSAARIMMQHKLMWPVEVYYRVGVNAPLRLTPQRCTESLLRQLRVHLQRAQQLFPALRSAPAVGFGLDLLLTSEQVVDLVTSGAQNLQAAGIDVLVPKIWTAVEPSLKLEAKVVETEPTGSAARSTKSLLGFDQLVNYRWEMAVGEMTLSPAEVNSLMRSTTGLVKIRDQWIHAGSEAAHRVVRFLEEQTAAGEELGTGVTSLRELRASEMEVREEHPELYGSGAVAGDGDGASNPQSSTQSAAQPDWLAAVVSDAAADQPEPTLPEWFAGQLRPYQQRGFQWLAQMSHSGFGAVLADDMGLGKTIQILALLAYENSPAFEEAYARTPQPTLLVVPTVVVHNWAAEAKRFAPDLKVGLWHGANRPVGAKMEEFITKHQVVITTHGLLTRNIDDLAAFDWEHVIVDEAQAIKNLNSKAAQAVRRVPTRHRIAMTGTPVENNLGELHAILDFVNPQMLGSARSFRARFATPIERDDDQQMREYLHSLTAPFILRRMKTDPDIELALPEKRENIVEIHMTAEQALLYQSCVDEMERAVAAADGISKKGIIFAAITKLKQICNHPAQYSHDSSDLFARGQHRSGKLAELEKIIDAAILAGEQVLVFSQFVEFGRMIIPWLEQRLGVTVPFIHGGVNAKARAKAIEEFSQSPQDFPVMMLSTMAAGVGINLVSANHVVHLDRWWNPAVENQATDRAYRIGQEKDVHVHKLVTIGTIEERIEELISGKLQLANSVITPGEVRLTELNLGQLHELWRLDRNRAQQAAEFSDTKWQKRKQADEQWRQLHQRMRSGEFSTDADDPLEPTQAEEH